MKLLNWSNLIYKYYLEREIGGRVILHITMQDLIDYAKDEDVEIANGIFASSCNDIFIRNNFVQQFWTDPKNGNRNLGELQTKINAIANNAINEGNIVVLFSIIAILIMPICENDDLELHGRDYYGHLFRFLINKRFVSGNEQAVETWSRSFLRSINLQRIWDQIGSWAEENNLNFKSKLIVSDNGSVQYALSLMKESLLSPSKIQKFNYLFDLAGLVPKANIEDNRLVSAFSNYYSRLDISYAKFRTLTSCEFKDYLISMLRSEYERWDGTTKIKERDRQTGKIKIESGNTCYPLLLCMDYYDDGLSNFLSFSLQLFCSDFDDLEYLSFKTDNNSILPDVYIKSDGFANRPFPLNDNELYELFSIRQGGYSIHEANVKTMKGRFVVTDYYLMKQYKNKYISTNEFIKGESYFAIIRNEAFDTFQPWLEENDAKLTNGSILGGFYQIYRIEHARQEFEQINNLKFKSEIRCRSINNLEVKDAKNDDVVLLSNLLPAQFEITGVDVSKDKLFAIPVETEKRRNSQELTYDHEKNLWIFEVPKNYFDRCEKYQLYCNERLIPYSKTYKFSDFIMPDTFEELPLDKWGMVSDEGFSIGLKLPDNVINNNLVNWQTLKIQMDNAPKVPIDSHDYKKQDYLLYAITSAAYDEKHISIEWLKSIKERIVDEFADEAEGPQSDKYALKNTLADYFRMGYINYAYTENGLIIVANRPTLVLLTPECERTVSRGLNGRNIVSINCIEHGFKCLLTGGRTIALIEKIEKQQKVLGFTIEYQDPTNILMPQTIYIHAEKRETFKQLAIRCNLLYQDNLYANALLEVLPSVEDYVSYQLSHGYERDLFLVKQFRCIDYARMAELFPQKIAVGKCITNSEIDKDEFDEENDVVVFFPGDPKDETSVMINGGRMIEIDKYWGHFIGMQRQNAKVLQYDEERNLISMPPQIRLPLLYARALTLITGKTPQSTYGSRAYNVVPNPLTTGCKAETILKKLGQE